MRNTSILTFCLAALLACDDGSGDAPGSVDATIALDQTIADAALDATVLDAQVDATAPLPDADVDAMIDVEDEARLARIEAAYQPWIDAGFFPSVSLALVSEAGVHFIGLGQGITDVAQPDTLYEIGSLSKVFTGLLLAEMVDDDVVALDTPIALLLPDEVTLPERTAAISLRALTTHHSGLPRLPDNMPVADVSNPYADYTVDLLYAFLEGFNAPAEPGFEYSNLGVGLLGHVLGQAASADGWIDALQARVLDPLEMSETGVVAADPARFIQGHTADGFPTSAWAFTDAVGAAGALRSSARDMARFAGAQFDDDSALAAAVRASQAPLDAVGPGAQIGHGWFHVEQFEALFHNGGTGGFVSFMAVDVAEKRAVVALYNGALPAIADALGWTAYEIWRGGDPEVPTPPVEAELSTAQLDRLTGVYRGLGLPPLVVERRDARLFITLGDQPSLGIYPLSEVDFYLRAVDARLRFDLEMDAATRVTLLQNGAETVLVRDD